MEMICWSAELHLKHVIELSRCKEGNVRSTSRDKLLVPALNLSVKRPKIHPYHKTLQENFQPPLASVFKRNSTNVALFPYIHTNPIYLPTYLPIIRLHCLVH